QAEPFQWAASGERPAAFTVRVTPTAHASSDASADTPFSTSSWCSTDGAATCRQVLPSQCAVSMFCPSASASGPVNEPTAQASVAVRTPTPFSPLPAADGFGDGVTVHVVAPTAGAAANR